MASPGGNEDFDRLRAEAQAVLDALLASQGDLGTMAGTNLELARTRAWATFDCLAPKWLQAAFQEVDRLQSWTDLRAKQVQTILDLHRPFEVEQVSGPMEANWLPPLICDECQVAFPCKTRTAALSLQRDLIQ